jgi:hypothetical protein
MYRRGRCGQTDQESRSAAQRAAPSLAAMDITVGQSDWAHGGLGTS